jgi:hypothetical protein
MRAKLTSSTALIYLFTGLALLSAGNLATQAADMKFEAQLIWGTNEKESPDPKHKPIAPDIKKKLEGLTLKWANWFVVNKQTFSVPAGGTKRVALSEKCDIEVKDLGHFNIEVTHYGKGKEVWKGAQVLGKGEIFPVLGGNAPNATAWLMVLKRLE